MPEYADGMISVDNDKDVAITYSVMPKPLALAIADNAANLSLDGQEVKTRAEGAGAALTVKKAEGNAETGKLTVNKDRHTTEHAAICPPPSALRAFCKQFCQFCEEPPLASLRVRLGRKGREAWADPQKPLGGLYDCFGFQKYNVMIF